MVDLVTAGISSNSFFSYLRGAAATPTFAPVQPLVEISEASAEGIAIQMLSAAIALGAGVTDLSNTAAIQAAVMAAVGAGVIPLAAVQPTPGLSTAVINTLDETLGGQMGGVIASTIAGLAGSSRSAAAMTLYGLLAQKIAAALGVPVSFVPASEIVKRLNPFANSTTGAAPAANNPWIAHADTELVCEFRKVKRLAAGSAPLDPVASVKRLKVLAGRTEVLPG
jgi:alkaline phosphatase D